MTTDRDSVPVDAAARDQLVERAATSTREAAEATQRRDEDLARAQAAGASMYELHRKTALSQSGIAKIIKRTRIEL